MPHRETSLGPRPITGHPTIGKAASVLVMQVRQIRDLAWVVRRPCGSAVRSRAGRLGARVRAAEVVEVGLGLQCGAGGAAESLLGRELPSERVDVLAEPLAQSGELATADLLLQVRDVVPG